jgi:hypothetical protein
MNLTGRNVRFRLSPQGRDALNEVASVTEYVDGLVVDENHLGLGFVTATSNGEHGGALEMGRLFDCNVGIRARSSDRAVSGGF